MFSVSAASSSFSCTKPQYAARFGGINWDKFGQLFSGRPSVTARDPGDRFESVTPSPLLTASSQPEIIQPSKAPVDIGDTVRIPENGLTIGRGLKNDMVIDHGQISREQGQFKLIDNQIVYAHLGANPVFVNTTKRIDSGASENLNPGDTITMSGIQFEITDEKTLKLIKTPHELPFVQVSEVFKVAFSPPTPITLSLPSIETVKAQTVPLQIGQSIQVKKGNPLGIGRDLQHNQLIVNYQGIAARHGVFSFTNDKSISYISDGKSFFMGSAGLWEQVKQRMLCKGNQVRLLENGPVFTVGANNTLTLTSLGAAQNILVYPDQMVGSEQAQAMNA